MEELHLGLKAACFWNKWQEYSSSCINWWGTIAFVSWGSWL